MGSVFSCGADKTKYSDVDIDYLDEIFVSPEEESFVAEFKIKVIEEGVNLIDRFSNYQDYSIEGGNAMKSSNYADTKDFLDKVRPNIDLLCSIKDFSDEMATHVENLLDMIINAGRSSLAEAFAAFKMLSKCLISAFCMVNRIDCIKQTKYRLSQDISLYKRFNKDVEIECDTKSTRAIIGPFFANASPFCDTLAVKLKSNQRYMEALCCFVDLHTSLIDRNKINKSSDLCNDVCVAMTTCMLIIDRISQKGVFSDSVKMNAESAVKVLVSVSTSATDNKNRLKFSRDPSKTCNIPGVSKLLEL